MNKKSVETRLQEILQIRTKMKDLGMDITSELDKFKKDCDEYIKLGISISGSIKLKEVGKKLNYNFPISIKNICNVNITDL